MCNTCASYAHDLIETRAIANRTRVNAQHELRNALEILGVVATVQNPQDWIDAAAEKLRFVIRDLDKLSKTGV